MIIPPNDGHWFSQPEIIGLVGRKARGLSLIPAAWRPPFAVLTAETYANWADEAVGADSVLREAVMLIEDVSRKWRQDWPRGLILRSSADNETLDDRGTYESVRLTADFGASQAEDALKTIFNSFNKRAKPGHLAVVVQPLVGEGPMGHLSNERRVSKSINHWQWERLWPDADQGRLNSQRDKVPNVKAILASSEKKLIRSFGGVGKWITSLGFGPAHLEWIYDGSALWLLQVDFEHEQPDLGVDPNAWLREADQQPTGILRSNSHLSPVELNSNEPPTPWRKIENVKRFAAARDEPFPRLAAITGDRFHEIFESNRKALEDDLEVFAHGRVVCRTDCKAPNVGRENLPRTYTVSSRLAVDSMHSFLARMKESGAEASDVCFLTHKFIPAKSGAWVRADPKSPIARVDSLWGVPDGLQYLPHDTFDVDVVRGAISADKVRYKSRFIQECENGTWEELKVLRTLARTRSLAEADAIAIARDSHSIATQAEKPLLIMWFCGIPEGLGIGSNLPWFSMPPNPPSALLGEPISPRWPRKTIRNLADVSSLWATGAAKNVLILDPELGLFRDSVFLEEVTRLAKRDHCPVQLAGSTLAHAHYQLEKAGVAVVPADSPGRTRARGRRSFAKLVRDEMPAQIAGRGELVVQSRLPRSEMRRGLVAKLLEEAQELLSANDPDDVKGELADLLEVLKGLAKITGVDWTEVEIAASVKRQRRGGFDEGAVLVGTEWPAANRTIQRAPALVTLRNLGKIVSVGRSGSASYNALLASDAGAELEINGRRIAIRMTREGINIEDGGANIISGAQLSLPFDEV